jgi:hypothetical protein
MKNVQQIESLLLGRYRIAAINYQCALRDGNEKNQLSTYQVLTEVEAIAKLVEVDKDKIENIRNEVNAIFNKE